MQSKLNLSLKIGKASILKIQLDETQDKNSVIYIDYHRKNYEDAGMFSPLSQYVTNSSRTWFCCYGITNQLEFANPRGINEVINFILSVPVFATVCLDKPSNFDRITFCEKLRAYQFKIMKNQEDPSELIHANSIHLIKSIILKIISHPFEIQGDGVKLEHYGKIVTPAIGVIFPLLTIQKKSELISLDDINHLFAQIVKELAKDPSCTNKSSFFNEIKHVSSTEQLYAEIRSLFENSRLVPPLSAFQKIQQAILQAGVLPPVLSRTIGEYAVEDSLKFF